GGQTAARRSAQYGNIGIPLRSIFFVDERLQYFDQQLPVNAGQAAAAFPGVIFRFAYTWRRRIFMDSFLTDVCHSHDYERLDKFSMNQSLRGFIDPPLDSGKRSGCVENVLAVVQV